MSVGSGGGGGGSGPLRVDGHRFAPATRHSKSKINFTSLPSARLLLFFIFVTVRSPDFACFAVGSRPHAGQLPRESNRRALDPRQLGTTTTPLWFCCRHLRYLPISLFFIFFWVPSRYWISYKQYYSCHVLLQPRYRDCFSSPALIFPKIFPRNITLYLSSWSVPCIRVPVLLLISKVLSLFTYNPVLFDEFFDRRP